MHESSYIISNINVYIIKKNKKLRWAQHDTQPVELCTLVENVGTVLVFDTLNIGTYSLLWTKPLIGHNIAQYF